MMQVCTTAWGQTSPIASGRPVRPSQTTMHIADTAILDLGEHPRPPLGALTTVAGPQTQHVPTAVHGDRQGHVDGPVRHLTIPDLDVDTVDEHHRIHRRPGAGSATRPCRP